jgi:AcrR family transcriptional regulator
MNRTSIRRQVSRLPRETRIAELLVAAREVFREKGYQDSLTSEIANRAGVVEGTLYRYFETKRDLLNKVLEVWYTEMIADFDKQLRFVHGTRNRLRYLLWRHLSVIHREPVLCRLVLMDLRADPAYHTTSVYQLNREYTHRTLEILHKAVESGEFRSDVPLTLVRDMIYGCVEHHTWNYLRGEGDFSVDDVADNIADMVYRAMAAEPAHQSGGTIEAAAGSNLSDVVARLERVAERLDGAASAPAKERRTKDGRKPRGG